MNLEELSLIYDALPTGICLVNQSREVVYGNENFKQLIGTADKPWQNLALGKVFPVFEEAFFSARLEQVFEEHTPMFISSGLHGDLLGVGLEKAVTYCEISISPLKINCSSSGELLVLSVENITDMMQQIRQQKNLLKCLHKQLKKSEVVKAEMKQVQQHLQEANTSKDKLFSIIGHDLRTPFAAMVAISELLMREAQAKVCEKETKKLYDSIWMASNQGMELVTNLFNWAQSQSNRIVAIPRTFNLLTMLDELRSLYHLNLNKKNLLLLVRHKEEKVFVKGDIDMIKVILQNLVSNAIKFSPEGEDVEVKIHKNGCDRVRVSVQDKGCGMRDTVVKAILNNERIEPAIGSHMEKGTGLGLTVCQDFLKVHNSTLEIDSTPGKGSTFSFSLPVSFEFV
ncbi:ATP-binding protein [Carboxylicivirga sp. RSCT41]|uniref:sensor histidine kinase n=1 Tax=Carboxylicivirga agarovorans TaxID=3417570 RepID=UPI003D35269C